MKSGLTVRLQTMMFLQFFLNGTTLPIFSLYLRDFLHFTGTQAGLVIGMSAASFVSPVLASLVADRLLRAERLYGLCHAVGGVLMLILSLQHEYPAGIVRLFALHPHLRPDECVG
jgi:NHS family xanthosine MFS transporter